MMRTTTTTGRLGPALVGASVAFVGGVYVAFPLVLAATSRLRPRPLRRTAAPPARVSVVVAAHDEASSIGRKLDELAVQRFGHDVVLEIIVASDGSTDATVPIARAHRSAPVVLDLGRVGKAAAMNAAIDRATGDVVVFTDANSRLRPDALDLLVAPFCDPAVGGVAGDQRYGEMDSGTADSERSYWSYERNLKQWQSSTGNVVSSTGTLHAIRRELIDEVPGDCTDDFYLSTGVVERGARLVFVPEACAVEEPNERPSAEYRRRVRIITRGLTGVWRRRRLLDPRRTGGYAVVLLVHKVLRRLVFVPLLLAAIGAAMSWRRGRWWRAAALAQAGLYAAAIVGLASPMSRPGRWRVVALPAHFCMANVAAAHAVLNLARGRRYVTWTPERS